MQYPSAVREVFEGSDGSHAVRKSVLNVRDGEFGIALLALDTPHNVRACRLALNKCTVQESCGQPSSALHVTDISETKKRKEKKQ